MYNKQVLSEALANLQKRKARLTQPKDIIVDPMGQYNHPGENTRIPGGDITMANVPYPVMAFPNVGQPQMMLPEQNYNFPGAEYVDEVPIMPKAQRGRNVRYTDNPNDPSIKAYADSLNAYNNYIYNESFNTGNLHLGIPIYNWDGFNPNKIKSTTLSPHSWKPFYKEGFLNSPGEVAVFKKPVQPVKYRDPKVVAKQQQLIDAGYDIGGADGIWGKKSQAAWDEMNAPVTEKSVETSFKEEQIPTAPREQRPTGLTKQVTKTQWKQLPDGTWYKDTKAGQNATVESTGTDVGGRKLKLGGTMGDPPPKIPYGSNDPTDTIIFPPGDSEYMNQRPLNYDILEMLNQKARREYENYMRDLKNPNSINKTSPQFQQKFHIKEGLGLQSAKYGGLVTGLRNTSGNLLMNKKGKRLMAQSGSLSATNELFLGNPLLTKRKKAVYVPGAAFQAGGSIDLELTNEQIDEYKRGGYIVEELPKAQKGLFNFSEPDEYVGYQGSVPVSESTRVANTYRPTEQEIKATKEYTQKVGATAQAIRKKTGVSHKEAMQQAEQVLDANTRVQSEAKAYANTKQAQERDAYVFGEGMNARDYYRYPLQFLSGNVPTQEERIQDRIRITDPRTSGLDKFIGTVGEAVNLAPEALLNTGIGLAFAPANLSKFGMVADAVSPVGAPNNLFKGVRAQNDILLEQARRSGEAPLPSYMEPYISRRYTPASKEQSTFESFLSPQKQAELRQSRTQTFTPEGVNTPKQLPGSSVTFSVDDVGRGKKGTKGSVTREDIIRRKKELEEIVNQNRDYINSDYYINLRMKNTGESKEKILKEIEKYNKRGDTFLLEIDDSPNNFMGSYEIKKNEINLSPSKFKNIEDALETFDHEVKHMFSPTGINKKAYKNYPKILGKPSLFQDFREEIFDINSKAPYYRLNEEQQVRNLRFREAIQKDLGLPLNEELTRKSFDKWLGNIEGKNLVDKLNNSVTLETLKDDVKNMFLYVDKNPVKRREIINSKAFKDKLFETLRDSWSIVPAAIATGAAASSNEYQQGGIVLDLSDDEIRKYQEAGYVTEEL